MIGQLEERQAQLITDTSIGEFLSPPRNKIGHISSTMSGERYLPAL